MFLLLKMNNNMVHTLELKMMSRTNFIVSRHTPSRPAHHIHPHTHAYLRLASKSDKGEEPLEWAKSSRTNSGHLDDICIPPDLVTLLAGDQVTSSTP